MEFSKLPYAMTLVWFIEKNMFVLPSPQLIPLGTGSDFARTFGWSVGTTSILLFIADLKLNLGLGL